MWHDHPFCQRAVRVRVGGDREGGGGVGQNLKKIG